MASHNPSENSVGSGQVPPPETPEGPQGIDLLDAERPLHGDLSLPLQEHGSNSNAPGLDALKRLPLNPRFVSLSAPREDFQSKDPMGDFMNWLEVADLSSDEDEAILEGQTVELDRMPLYGRGRNRNSLQSGLVPVGYSGGEPPVQRTPVASGSAVDVRTELHRIRQDLSRGSNDTKTDDAVPPFLVASRAAAVSYCGLTEEEQPKVEPEEEEWDLRQQQTGAAGRLVVYEVGDRPREDLLLRGGAGRRVMVAAVTDSGKAVQAGVKAGDVLVSINGTKDFQGLSADEIHNALRAPVMLVFMGFVGKLQAEVRLNYKQKQCGLSSQTQVIVGRPEAPVQVMDEIVFKPSNATLFLATKTPGYMSAASRPWSNAVPGARNAPVGDTGLLLAEEEDDDEADIIDIDTLTSVTGDAIRGAQGEPPEVAAVYELRGHEARRLVSRALSRTSTTSPSVGGQRGWLLNGGAPDANQAPRGTFASPFGGDVDARPAGADDAGLRSFDGSQSRGTGAFPRRTGKICDIESWFGSQCD